MYKLNKEYEGQSVTCFLASGKIVKLDLATQVEFEEVYKIPGNQKFITKNVIKDEKEVKKVIEDNKKVVKGNDK